MAPDLKTRAKDLILGALVADAAAMGLHWIYDQDHIRRLAPAEPEFHEPLADNYAGVPSYFAHAGRRVGEPSHYGEQALVMLRSLAANNGRYDVNRYSQLFRAHFGYGGAYVGYIDNSTRETLDNFRRAEDEALSRAKAIPFDGDEMVTVAMVVKALALLKQSHGDELRRRFEEAVRVTHDDDDIVSHGFAVLDLILSMDPVYGAKDEQFPAISKLPALVAVTKANGLASRTSMSKTVESAVRVTSDHERSVAYGQVCARMMEAAIEGENRDKIITAGHRVGNPEITAAIEAALSMTSDDVSKVTSHFGLACDLRYGVPSVIHNISTAPSFREAIRRNIYAGGDTCGRSMLLGAVLGAAYGIGGEYGIPEAWIEKLSFKDELRSALSNVLD